MAVSAGVSWTITVIGRTLPLNEEYIAHCFVVSNFLRHYESILGKTPPKETLPFNVGSISHTMGTHSTRMIV